MLDVNVYGSISMTMKQLRYFSMVGGLVYTITLHLTF